jgi:peptidoglycan hydrolase-like protein with peptidoglycan-binding domain
MAIVSLYKYDKGIDYAVKPTALTYDSLKTKGHKFIARYINGTAHTSKPSYKCINKTEMSQILASGLGLILIFEKTATRAIPGSIALAKQYGIQDATEAASDIAYLGYPSDAFLIVAAGDTDITSSNVYQAVAYWTAFNDNISNPCGVYGDYELINALAGSECSLFSQTNAAGWSKGRISPYTHLLQTSTFNGYDGNIVLRPTSIYGLSANATPANSTPFGTFNPAAGSYGSYPYNQNLPKLSRGASGVAVKFLQGILRKTVDGTLPINGVFDLRTYNAVMAFQKKFKTATFDGVSASSYMSVDGVVGRETWGVISNIAMNM